MFQCVLKGGKLLVDLGFSQFPLPYLSEGGACFFDSILREQPSRRLYKVRGGVLWWRNRPYLWDEEDEDHHDSRNNEKEAEWDSE